MMKEDVKAFLDELKELQQKYNLFVEATASATDDTGLESWLQVVRYVKSNRGRVVCTVEFEGELT
jgi:hypothetical protein